MHASAILMNFHIINLTVCWCKSIYIWNYISTCLCSLLVSRFESNMKFLGINVLLILTWDYYYYQEGLAMIDDGHRDGKRRYWFPCVTVSSDTTGGEAKWTCTMQILQRRRFVFFSMSPFLLWEVKQYADALAAEAMVARDGLTFGKKSESCGFEISFVHREDNEAGSYLC